MRGSILAMTVAVMAMPTTATAQETIAYTYDVRGRVVQLDHTGSVNDGRQTIYTYDDANNRTERWRGVPASFAAALDHRQGDVDVAKADGRADGGDAAVSGHGERRPGATTDPTDPLFDG